MHACGLRTCYRYLNIYCIIIRLINIMEGEGQKNFYASRGEGHVNFNVLWGEGRKNVIARKLPLPGPPPGHLNNEHSLRAKYFT